MIKYLAESDRFKVISICENVYLKDKSKSRNLVDYEKGDLFIASHYGDPTSAIIMHSDRFIVVGGCGLTIFDNLTQGSIDLLDDPNDITWVKAIYQDQLDNQLFEFCFVAYFQNDHLRVYKMNLASMKIEMTK